LSVQIHSTAIVHPKASLADDVVVGPFCMVGEHVRIGKGTRLLSHVAVDGWTEIGERNEIHPFVSLGGPPQHLHYKGEPTKVIIGNDNILREYITVNRATAQGGGVTSLGSKDFLMAYVHIAHDCVVGDRSIFANGASLAGHVHIEDDVVLGGFALVYQFTRLGMHSFCGFACGVHRDVPPYVTVAGYRAEPHGINAEGLRRRGFSDEEVQAIRRAYKVIYRANLRLEEALDKVREMTVECPRLQILADFLATPSRNGIVR